MKLICLGAMMEMVRVSAVQYSTVQYSYSVPRNTHGGTVIGQAWRIVVTTIIIIIMIIIIITIIIKVA
jgi:hypothetical protein